MNRFTTEVQKCINRKTGTIDIIDDNICNVLSGTIDILINSVQEKNNHRIYRFDKKDYDYFFISYMIISYKMNRKFKNKRLQMIDYSSEMYSKIEQSYSNIIKNNWYSYSLKRQVDIEEYKDSEVKDFSHSSIEYGFVNCLSLIRQGLKEA